MKLGKAHLAGSLAMVVASIGYNAWVFGRPAARSGPPASNQAPLVDGLAPTGPVVTGEPGVTTIDPTLVPPPPDVELDRAPEWPRDPFLSNHVRPAAVVIEGPAPEADVEPDVVVGSILYSADRHLAVVNGRIVRVGDRIGSITILEIQPRAIVIESSGGGRRTLELRTALTRKASK
ncbi:MAG TPA: hypothetical protein VI485_01345 [Vicinamibacterales bacterium]|nr:hypothetical protein [Vicinamibacterales bacterium]